MKPHLTPAFPVFPDTSVGHESAYHGISVLDYFAAEALKGLLVGFCSDSNSWHKITTSPEFAGKELLASMSYKIAEALVNEKQKFEAIHHNQ